MLFDTRRITGLNAKKSDIGNYVRTSKAYHPLKKEIDTLIVGNSRVEMGLNPRHQCLRKLGKSTYNLGVPGIGVGGQLTYALNIILQTEVKEVFLSLDFTDFLISDNKSPNKANPLPPIQIKNLEFRSDGSPNKNYQRQMLLDYYQALFSLDALSSSIKTFLNQNNNATDRDEYGFNPANDFLNVAMIEGPNALFEQKHSELEKKYSRKWYLKKADGTLPTGFTRLRAFLVTAKEHNVKVTLFTNPLHGEFWGLMKKHNHFGKYKEWLVLTTGMISEMDNLDLKFWDFSYDSSYIHETVPAPGEKTKPLKWFWEPAHYRQELGDIMLKSMLSERCNSSVKFGRLLTEKVIYSP